MTQPAVKPQSQPPPPETLANTPPSEQTLLIGIAGLLAIGAAYEATSKSLVVLLAPLRLPAAAIKTATRIAMSTPTGDQTPPGARPTGSAQTTARLERMFRATYLLAAAKRIARQMREGKEPMEIIRAERLHFQRHLQAQARRKQVAREIDRAATVHGPILGWYAKMDARTSPECRWANGRNFDVAKRPPIGYPGTVHPNCRCKPGVPFATGKSVYNQKEAKAKARTG